MTAIDSVKGRIGKRLTIHVIILEGTASGFHVISLRGDFELCPMKYFQDRNKKPRATMTIQTFCTCSEEKQGKTQNKLLSRNSGSVLFVLEQIYPRWEEFIKIETKKNTCYVEQITIIFFVIKEGKNARRNLLAGAGLCFRFSITSLCWALKG